MWSRLGGGGGGGGGRERERREEETNISVCNGSMFGKRAVEERMLEGKLCPDVAESLC